MRSGMVLVAMLAIGIFRHERAIYVPPKCMDHIRFTKPCREISASLCVADGVEVTFRCVGASPEGPGKVKVKE